MEWQRQRDSARDKIPLAFNIYRNIKAFGPQSINYRNPSIMPIGIL